MSAQNDKKLSKSSLPDSNVSKQYEQHLYLQHRKGVLTSSIGTNFTRKPLQHWKQTLEPAIHTSKITAFSCLVKQSWMHISFICMALNWSQGELCLWSLKKVPISDQKGSWASSNTALQGSTRAGREAVKPALFFLESTFQVILNKKKMALSGKRVVALSVESSGCDLHHRSVTSLCTAAGDGETPPQALSAFGMLGQLQSCPCYCLSWELSCFTKYCFQSPKREEKYLNIF